MHSAIVFAVLAVAAASPAQAQLRLSTNTTERVVASRIVRGEPSAPSITVTSARDDDGRAIVSARCAREVEQTIVEDVEVTTAGFWPVYAGITVLGSVGVVGGGVAAAMASSDPTADPFNVAMGATAAGVGALGILVGGVGLLGSLPATTTEKRERAGDPVTEPCSSALLRIEGGRWADEAVTDYAGEVTFEMPSEIQHAKVEVVDERGGAPDVSASVEAPPGRPRRSNSAALEAESDTEAAASKTPLPAVGLNAATAPPLVCPDGAHVEGGRPPAATTEVCKRPDGKKEGGFRQWADDGSLKLEGQYRDDAADGPWQGWHPNGERQFVGAYAAGKWSGVWNYWGPDGQRKADVTYRDGRDVTSEPAMRALRPAVTPAELQAEADADRAAEARRDAELAARAAEQADFDRRYQEDATRAQGQRRARVAAAWDAQRDHSILGATQFVAENGEDDLPDDVSRILRAEIQETTGHIVMRAGKTRWWFAKAPASAFDEYVRCGLLASREEAAWDWAYHACSPMRSNPRGSAAMESTAVKLDDKTWIVLTEAPKFFEAICGSAGVANERLRAVAERKARSLPAGKLPVSAAWLDSKLDHRVWPVSPVLCSSSLGKK